MRDVNETPELADALKWGADGLIPAIVQDVENGDVLMVAWMDEEALRATIATGQTHFYSRSRRSHWHKGGTSGHVQHVESIWIDCDGDVILIKARQVGGACHEGYRSCFFRRVDAGGARLETAARPMFDADKVYGKVHDSTAAPASAEKPRVKVPDALDARIVQMGDFDEVVVLPHRESGAPAHIRSPRLARPEQAASFAKQQIDPPIDL